MKVLQYYVYIKCTSLFININDFNQFRLNINKLSASKIHRAFVYLIEFDQINRNKLNESKWIKWIVIEMSQMNRNIYEFRTIIQTRER